MPRDENWEMIFDVLLKRVKGSANLFIQSVHDSFKNNGRLSPKQEAAILKFWVRTSDKHKGLK